MKASLTLRTKALLRVLITFTKRDRERSASDYCANRRDKPFPEHLLSVIVGPTQQHLSSPRV